MTRPAPTLAVTLGDPAGIGPEVVCKWLADPATRAALADGRFRVLLVGTPATLAAGRRVAETAGFDCTHLGGLTASQPGETPDAALALFDTGVALPEPLAYGAVEAACGRAAVTAIERAAELCLAGDAQAMVTAPINKESVNASGCADIGHQEMLARLAGVDWTATMLMTPGLRVAHLSTHKSLAEAVRYVTRDNVLGKLELVHSTLMRWGLRAPRIAVAALNPHGGEGGLLGREEIDELLPAVAAARAQGIDAAGPIPADSVFNRAIDGEFDVVLALFHDQGHIAIKVHDFHNSVTATLGIPFVRTSVDHGTAFDIAGRGVADATGMGAAVDAALALATGRLGDFQPR
ncbi:MAG: 4-hydroxythreonine-4-phosphate dehydrogenase PdxA [Pseudomonadota bacterium]